MKQLPTQIAAAIVLLIVLAALTPTLERLSGALIPAVVVVAIALIAVRLAFFHTRGW